MFIQNKRPDIVADPRSFIDTLALLSDIKPSNQFFLDMRSLSHSCVAFRSLDCRLKYKICIHRPRPKAFDVLNDLASKRNVMINEVHVALDLPVESFEEATNLVEWLGSRIVKRWPGKHRFRTHRSTLYSAARSWPSNQITIYPNVRSKVYCGSAAHIEWRIKGAQLVRRMGINNFDDIRNIDYVAFWTKRLLLEEAQPEKLGQELRTKNIVKSTGRADLHLGSAYLRAYMYQSNCDIPVPAMAMRAMSRKWPRINKKKVLRPIDMTPFLPRPNDSAQSIISLDKLKVF